MDRIAALKRATDGFASVLARVPAEAWAHDSINAGWTVHDLVNHVVGGNFRYVLLLDGRDLETVEALRTVDHLGEDPMEDFAASSAAMLEAFDAPGALEMTVHHRLGDRSGSDLLTMRLLEHSLHGWDLARSIGVDETIDPEVVTVALNALDADPGLLARTGYAAVAATDDGDDQRRLLHLTGRSAQPSTD